MAAPKIPPLPLSWWWQRDWMVKKWGMWDFFFCFHGHLLEPHWKQYLERNTFFKWNNGIRNSMDGPRDYHTKQSKSEREGHKSYNTTYMWNLKYGANQHFLWSKNRFTDIENRAGEWMRKGGKDWDLGIIRGKLVCIEWINNTVLPYRTGNHIQHPVTNHDGNECVCVCECERDFAVQKTLTQHCGSTCFNKNFYKVMFPLESCYFIKACATGEWWALCSW